ncbi:class I SAM-dependent methyltransferase [Gammaproteobacteria bacterium]|nr:class I SAM-dependent methyltransferase [Gammaproteobacteria bacterium]
MNWNEGYVTDVDYTYGYYTELNPVRIKLAFANVGIKFPNIGTACELGFGQGLSSNVHASASVTSWHGNDFNPAQAAFAQELAEASGSGAKFVDESFEAFCGRSDLPNFDYIALHGIWSWISDDNRQAIVDFARRKLNVGGVLYISYNTLPGWAPFAPIRHLLTRHSEYYGVEGNGRSANIEASLNFADTLTEVNPSYFQANPSVATRLNSLKEANKNYLAHEYFNRDWHPMHFADMADWLKPAALSFVCSAHFIDHMEVANLTKPQLDLLNTITHPIFKQSVRDFMVNQGFRKDYWVKGPRNLTSAERLEVIRDIRVTLIKPASDISLKAKGSLGEVTFSEEIYGKVIAQFDTSAVKSLGELEKSLKESNIKLAEIFEVALALSGTGDLSVAQDDESIKAALAKTQKLNKHLIGKARTSNEIGYLASPVIGGAVPVERFHQIFISAVQNNCKTASKISEFTWSIIAEQNQRLIVDGAMLETEETNVKELTRQANDFMSKNLAVYQNLMIC